MQQVDLSLGDHPPNLPGLKIPSHGSRLVGPGQEGDRAPRLHLPALTEDPSPDGSRAGSDPVDPGNITIPRPHGRKTPELGSIITLPVSQTRPRPSGGSSGGQEFRQALSKTGDEERGPSCDAGLDVISLLDPLSSSASASEGVQPGLLPSSHRPPPGPSPQTLPPFPLHPPLLFNPFVHGSSRPAVLPSPGPNPFSGSFGPRQGPYFQAPPPSLPLLPGVYGGLSPSPHSSHSLSSLAGSRSLPPRPVSAEDHRPPQDPFGDLLTLAQTPRKMEEVQRRWETFD